MNISDLPQDILLAIFAKIDYLTLIRSSSVCRFFKQIIANSLLLQYHIVLFASCKVDNENSSLTLQQRHDALLEHNTRWLTLNWAHQTSILMPKSAGAYENIGGIFSRNYQADDSFFQASRHLIAYELPRRFVTSGDDEGNRSDNVERFTAGRGLFAEDVGLRVRDFVFDNTQDLLVIFEDGETQLNVHIWTLSGRKPHPEASKPHLSRRSPDQVIHSTVLQVVDDVVALYTSADEPAILIWNWKTGKLLVEKNSTEFSPSPGFCLLSRDVYTLCECRDGDGQSGSIQLWNISRQSSTSYEIERLVTLRLPPISDSGNYSDFFTFTTPDLDSVPQDLPFSSSGYDKLVVFSITFIDKNWIENVYALFVHNSTLLDLAYEMLQEARSGEVLAWEQWGPERTRLMPHSVGRGFVRSVSGQRVICVPEREDNNTSIRVYDFTPPSPYYLAREGQSDCERYIHKSTSPTVIGAGDLFEDRVQTMLPYTEIVRHIKNTTLYEAFLVDEERILGYDAIRKTREGEKLDVFIF